MTDPIPHTHSETKNSNLELIRRVISGLVLAIVALVADYLGGVFFSGLWVVAAALVLREWLALVGVDGAKREYIFVIGSFVLAIFGYFSSGGNISLEAYFYVLVAGFCFILILNYRSIILGLWSCAGLCYSLVLVVSPIFLRGDSTEGFLLVLWLFAVVWFADIGAFFVGRKIGGPKLWPAVSPKKTWSGFIGGVLLGASAGFGVAFVGQEFLSVSWFQGTELLLFSLGCALISQAGDLFESALKRRFHRKDSGQLIPGHGGIMDRLDSFVAASFYALVVINVFGSGNPF